MQRTWGHCCPSFSCPKFASREVQAVEGKKLAESWGATFMESSARDKQVLGLKIRKVVGVAVLWHCLVVGMVREWGIHLRVGWYWQ